MNTLKIKWQRLLINGQTCPRCKLTEEELEKAISILKQYLNPLRIEIMVELLK
jgi:predicted DsbA family dithiol-disulfide isomerase